MNDNYEDIISLPHHVSNKRQHMPVADRAAQFSPFAALTGFDTAINESARITDERLELDESIKADINEKLVKIAERLKEHPQANITYFVKDANKDGGAYKVSSGAVKKLHERLVIMQDGIKIPIDDIAEIDILL